jgi:hypothetical protein
MSDDELILDEETAERISRVKSEFLAVLLQQGNEDMDFEGPYKEELPIEDMIMNPDENYQFDIQDLHCQTVIKFVESEEKHLCILSVKIEVQDSGLPDDVVFMPVVMVLSNSQKVLGIFRKGKTLTKKSLH